MPTEAFASPLTVWVGPRHYTFPAGRDVTVGRDSRCDVRLGGTGPATSPTHVVLHHDGRRWVAIDHSQSGIYVDGVRMSRVLIRNGLAISLGDPRHGLRLAFEIGRPTAPTSTPPPGVDRLSERSGQPKPLPGQLPPWSARPERPAGPSQPKPPRVDARPRLARPSQLPTQAFRDPQSPPQSRRTLEPPSQLTTQRLRLPRLPQQQPPQPSGPVTPHLAGLEVHRVGLSVAGQPVLADISFTAQPGTLSAVIGPSEVARTSLVRIVGGVLRPGAGRVAIDGHDLYAEDMRRHRIGMVPQDDLLHPQLTIEQALGYLAELRLPPNTSANDRRQVVDRVLGELELTALRTVQVGTLTREQRKRASAAAELLTDPSVLVLEEPTAGLDTAQERRIVAALRRVATAGRVVVVSTTSVDQFDGYDQVLTLNSTGLLVSGHQRALPEQAPAAAAEPLTRPAHIALGRQIALAMRRQTWLVIADQRYLIFLTLLPVLFGGLVLLVPGHTGLGPADLYGNSPDEALEILVLLIFGAVVMGTASTIRDIRRERAAFRREHADGLSTTAYLTAKIGVYSLIAMAQAAVTTTVAVAGKGAPSHSAVLLGTPMLELYLAVVVTAIVSALVALALSSMAGYAAQLLLMAVLVVLISVLFCGGVFPLNGRFGLEQFAWLLPSRWGFAAAASTVDLPEINSLASSDQSWTHSAGWWLFDMAMLIALGVMWILFVCWRLRRSLSEQGSPTGTTSRPR
ncbi:ATP-binding cassette domain-containing protein [Mycobacterium sp.]|uniref:ATP-binding cassette domain-containing protein n=1 Tax=Mycobacterium sp. TaxID=1785 RepID=UPI001287D7A3|nr:ATP-binding cassette domain-containing protein [Mycobacterium sp.]KAA8962745.1 MAG: ATP-binding cassette domain-containing protein [Mycobacterium sp.]